MDSMPCEASCQLLLNNYMSSTLSLFSSPDFTQSSPNQTFRFCKD